MKSNQTTFIHLFIILIFSLGLTSCSKDSGGSSADAISLLEEIAVAPEEGAADNSEDENTNDDNNEGEGSENPPVVEIFEQIYEQTFDDFAIQGNWMLSDFNLQGERDKELYTEGSLLGFDIRWTKRTRNQLADIMGYERSEMTHEFTNSVCEPKIEIGKEKVYLGNGSENLIAELDTDVSHCGVSGTEPATISMRSFVPTKIGYKYKVKVRYMMRSYNAQTQNSYRDLVVRFGKELEKFDPAYEGFQDAELTMVALRPYSKLVLSDNGLPNSFGILIDNILIGEGQKVELYDACAEMFHINSRGFRKCIQGEVETNQTCDLSDSNNAIVKTSKANGVAANRRDEANIFNVSAAQNGVYNFFSLGLKGKVSISCGIDGHRALYPIEGKTVTLNEISWNNATVSSYPEIAKIRVKLSGCDDETLNRTTTIGTVQTNEAFSYTFNTNSEEKSYAGCNLEKFIIKDITPNGPSTDGFDLNSLQFSNNNL